MNSTVCRKIPISVNVFGRVKNTYVHHNVGALCHTLRRGSKVQLGERVRLVNNSYVVKEAGPVRSVLNVHDYRYASQFDWRSYQAIDPRKKFCSPYPSHASMRHINTVDGKSAVQDICDKAR